MRRFGRGSMSGARGWCDRPPSGFENAADFVGAHAAGDHVALEIDLDLRAADAARDERHDHDDDPADESQERHQRGHFLPIDLGGEIGEHGESTFASWELPLW
jgi:hypothetical protein